MTEAAVTDALSRNVEVARPTRAGRLAPGRRVRRESLPGRWSGAHLPALDGLRGLAVAGVLAFHDRRLEGGWLGVDLFFTLSGFLITSLLVAEVHRSSGVALGRFWQRRARRLLPAFLTLVAVLVAWSTFRSDTPWATSDVRGASVAALAYVANWYQAFAGGGYWNRFSAPSPLQHAWSLAIEEQFYLVFPLVVWACARLSRRPVRLLLVVCSIGWAASMAATLVLGAGSGNTNRVYLGTDTRVGSVLLGCMLACVLAILPKRVVPDPDVDAGPEPEVAAAADAAGTSGHRAPSTWPADAAALGAVVVLVLLWSTVDGEGSFGLRGGLGLHALLVCVVIAVVVRVPGSLVGRVLAWRPLVWLGTISYGLYLWHWPVFLYVDLEVHLGTGAETLVKVGVSLALAVASLLLVERPLRRNGAAVLGGVIPTVAVVAVVVLGAALVPAPRSIAGSDQLADAPRTLDDLRALPSIGGDAATSSTGPTTTVPPTEDLPDLVAGAPAAGGVTSVLDRPGRVPGPARMLVVGDSVPFLLTEALVPVQDQFGLVVANRALPACSAADPDAERLVNLLPTPPDCLGRWAEDAVAFDPDLVLISLNGDVGVELQYDGVWGGTCTSSYRERLEERLLEGLPAITERGARVFMLSPLLAQVPFYRPDGAGESRACVTKLERRVAEEVPGASTVGFGEWVCPDPDEDCRTSLGGTSVDRADGVHFTGESALVVWRLVLPPMLKAAGVS